ncbi:MAG: hypothetical protein ABIH71_02290 [Candidatus Omnitrophota bacterium]|nr:hypothetical protein [Candidatus Omnitrophota bacterium]
MVKSVLKAVLVSFFLLTISCNIAPTYSRQDVDKSIKKICDEEFNIPVEAWLIEDTFWVYAPFKEVFDDSFQWNQETLENVRRIFLSLSRVLLSVDRPPSFFAFVISDVEKIGADLYYIGFIPDMVKMQTLFISLGQWQEREVIINSLNPQALGDYTGAHINKANITMGEFISYLINQEIRKHFNTPLTKDNFQIVNLKTVYVDTTLNVTFNIMIIKNDMPNLEDPFQVIKETTKKFLKIYNDYAEITEVKIIDTAANKHYTYSKKDLL